MFEKEAASVPDNSENTLRLKMGEGFTHAILHSHGEGASCEICSARDAQTNASPVLIKDLLDKSTIDRGRTLKEYKKVPKKTEKGFGKRAPLFAFTHPGCTCLLELVSEYDEFSNASFTTDYSGTQIGESKDLDENGLFVFYEAIGMGPQEIQKQIDEMMEGKTEKEFEESTNFDWLEKIMEEEEKTRAPKKEEPPKAEEAPKEQIQVPKEQEKKEEPKPSITDELRKQFKDSLDVAISTKQNQKKKQLEDAQKEYKKINKPELTTKEFGIRKKLLDKIKKLKKELSERK